MVKKMKGPIVKVHLNEATFHNKEFEPTLINFIYGKNGAGKTTISRVLKDGNLTDGSHALDWKSIYQETQSNVLVFNQDFIRSNIESLPFMSGVFSLDQQNIKLRHQIESIRDEIDNSVKRAEELSKEQKQCVNNLGFRIERHDRDLWNFTMEARTMFPGTEAAEMSMKDFSKKLATVEGKEHSLDDLKLLYQKVFISAVSKRDLLSKPDTVFPEGVEILSEPILPQRDSSLFAYMNELDLTEWVMQGNKKLLAHNVRKCPFCQKDLPEDFQEQIAQCFDQQYMKKIKKLDQFLVRYYKYTRECLDAYGKLLNSSLVFTGKQLVEEVYEKLNDRFTKNCERITGKQHTPMKTVTLQDTASLIEKLNTFIDMANVQIIDHNLIVERKEEKKSEFNLMLWEYLAWITQEMNNEFDRNYHGITDEISQLIDRESQESRRISSLRKEIASLATQLLDTDSAVQNINDYLQRVGFLNFYIRKREYTDDQYEIVRLDETKASDTLSEGERNFIAFLYFYERVRGGLMTNETQDDKVVVIDDPVSSMDSDIMQLVAFLVKNMLENCSNNAKADAQGEDYIKQIFILTHNQSFQQMITADYEKEWEYVSFFQVAKNRNESDIQLMTKADPDRPAYTVNLNPVKSPYVNLWIEYTEAKDIVQLITAAQNILGDYFIKFCGCSGKDISDIVLNRHKDELTPRDNITGRLIKTKWYHAQDMLAYFSAKGTGVIDGFYYGDKFSDLDEAREAFEDIFRLTGHEAHYRMMMEQAQNHKS